MAAATTANPVGLVEQAIIRPFGGVVNIRRWAAQTNLTDGKALKKAESSFAVLAELGLSFRAGMAESCFMKWRGSRASVIVP